MPDSTQELEVVAEALAPDFALECEIGRGGMGVVYRGMDVRLDRPVAIKVLPASLADVPEVRERFLREARTAARLSHPHIVPIYRADERRGVVFIVMAYVDGESLGERLTTQGVLPASEIVPILHDVACALDRAHGHGVVHRDIKPENILIDRVTGVAMVTDFGIARLAEAKPLTATGQVLGTVHYMSPEQVSGEAVDGRSDLYSLGVVAFRALTGRLPFDNESASAVLVAHVVKRPPTVREVAPDVPGELAEVVDRCLAKDPAARVDSGNELARLLNEALQASRAAVAMATRAQPEMISDREAHALLARAAELQAQTGVQQRLTAPALPPRNEADPRDRRTLTSGYRYDDVRDSAREAGIPERYVSRAASELGIGANGGGARVVPAGEVAPLTDVSPSAFWLSGGPMAAIYEVEVPGEVPAAEMYVLVDTIRRRMGDAGQVGAIGPSVSWSAMNKHRHLQISLIARHGKTSIRLEERMGTLAGKLFGGIVGGAGGGSGGLVVGLGMALTHSMPAAVGLWGISLSTTYVIARTIYGRMSRRRADTLRSLANELAAQARELVTSGTRQIAGR